MQHMSKAERDIERILDGERIQPNPSATTAYKQRIVDYMMNNQDALKNEQFMALVAYADSLDEIISQNMVRQANEQLLKQTLAQPPTEETPTTG